MIDISRFGVSVEEDLLQSFDRLIAEQGYENLPAQEIAGQKKNHSHPHTHKAANGSKAA